MMSRSNTFIIAEEGWKYLLLFAIATIVLGIIDADLLQSIAIIAFFATGYIYRNPEREVPHFQRGSIVAPVDGRVTAVEESLDRPKIGSKCLKVTVRSGCFDTSLLRAPFDMRVTALEHRHGARLSLKKTEAQKLNELVTIELDDDHGHKLVVEHLLEQSPEHYLACGDRAYRQSG